jgi:hypothetical protein
MRSSTSCPNVNVCQNTLNALANMETNINEISQSCYQDQEMEITPIIPEPTPIPQPIDPIYSEPIPQPIDPIYPEPTPIPQPIFPIVPEPIPQPIDPIYPEPTPIPRPIDPIYPEPTPIPQPVDPIYQEPTPTPQPITPPLSTNTTTKIEASEDNTITLIFLFIVMLIFGAFIGKFVIYDMFLSKGSNTINLIN